MAAPWSVYHYFVALVDFVIMPGGRLEIPNSDRVPVAISGHALKEPGLIAWRTGGTLPSGFEHFEDRGREATTITRVVEPRGAGIEAKPAPRLRIDAVELSWQPVAGAEKYHCGVLDLGPSAPGLIFFTSNKTTLVGRDLKTTSIKVAPSELMPGHAYAWYVSAENVWGAAFSEYAIFHTLPEEFPAPAISQP